MPSPFPGMDPYVENPSIWPDFHSSMIAALRAQLNTRLPDRYVASSDRHVWRDEPVEGMHLLLGEPDVTVSEETAGENAGAPSAVGVAAPIEVELPPVSRKGSIYLRVIDRDGGRIVSVVELLSPSNKAPGEKRDAYLRKREEYQASGVNLVEIDLLRDGLRPPVRRPPRPPADYFIIACRASEAPRARLWAFSVRDVIPVFAFPLDLGVPDIEIDLRPCCDRAYDEGRYGIRLKYAGLPDPPLREPDATWARELLAARTAR